MDIPSIIKSACEERYQQQPSKITKFDSLANWVYKLDFEERESVVIKVFNKTKTNFFLFRFPEIESAIKKTDYFGDLNIFENDVYKIEKLINCQEITTSMLQKHSTRILVMREIARFHQLLPLKTKDDALIIDTWKHMKDNICGQIFKNFEGSERIGLVREMIDIFDEFITKELYPNFDTSEVTLCHNDLLSGNLLFDLDKQKFILIDFEYSGYGSPWTDIYNILIESTYDYTDKFEHGFKQNLDSFPSDDQFREIIRFYLFFKHHASLVKEQKDSEETIEFIKNLKEFQDIPETEVTRIFDQIFFFGSVTNVYWSIWGLFIFKKEGGYLNYPEYAINRYQDFKSCQERVKSQKNKK